MSQDRSNRRATLRESLGQLGRYSTVSPFARSFYGLLCDWVEDRDLAAPEIETALALLLRIEVRHHEAIEPFVGCEALNLSALLDITRRKREMLSRLLRAIRSIPHAGDYCELIRQLLLAECYYHLGQPERVVRSLRAAIDMGASHPILSFALGYNLYSRAVQNHVHMDGRGGRFVVSSAVAFHRTICQAIAAFREGVSGQVFDAQFYWWIGLLSEIICERADAVAAYSKACQIDPDGFAGPVREKRRKLSRTVLDAARPEESDRLSDLPAITDDDLADLRRRLAESDALPGLFQEP